MPEPLGFKLIIFFYLNVHICFACMYFWFLVVLVQVDREKEMAYIIRLGHKVRACV